MPDDDEDVPDDDEDELETALLLLGSVGELPHPTPNMPAPARATPPDSILRNCRRSSRRVASSTGCGFSD